MSEPIVRVRNVSKRFIATDLKSSLWIMSISNCTREIFWR